MKAHHDLIGLEEMRERSGHRYRDIERYVHMFDLLGRADGSTPAWDEEVRTLDAWVASGAAAAEPIVRTVWMLVLCAAGRHDLVLAQSRCVWSRLFETSLGVHAVDHVFLRGLALAAQAAERTGRPRRALRRELLRALGSLQRWARHGPDFVHMALALEAESAALRGNVPGAHRLFQGAVRRALQQEFSHHAALILERHASVLGRARRDTEAAAARTQALALYRAWGAHAVVSARAREADAEG